MNFRTSKNRSFSTAIAAFSLTVITAVSQGCVSEKAPTAEAPKPEQKTEQVAITPSASPATLANLQAAYNGESNAHVRYLAFAKKADAEGYAQVGSLFRAAAKAEQIHRDYHATVIRKMGATPENKIETPEVKSTADNLQAAIKGESYERDTMYPQFIAEAQKSGNKDAVRSFEYAVSAEKEHAKLYTAASNNLADWKVAKAFYVCPECGFTVMAIDFANCPECGTPKAQFEQVI